MPKKYAYTKKETIEGKRYTFYADSEPELYKKIALREKEIQEGRVLVTGSMTVRQWVEICLKTYKSNVRPATLEAQKPAEW